MHRHIACALLLASAAASPAQAPPAAPVTAAPDDVVARDFLDAVNSGDPARIEAFAAASLSPQAGEFEPVDQLVRRMKALQAQSGGIENVEWTSRGDPVRFTGRSRRHGIVLRGLVGVENGRMLGFQIEPDRRLRGPDAPAWPDAAASDTEALQIIDRELDWLARDGRFSGTVWIARRGRPVLERAFGLARRGPDVPNSAQTAFHTASTTKMFTSAAIAQLVDAGKLTLDTTVAEAVPALAGAPAADRTRIRDLLGHRVSYGDYFFTDAHRALEQQNATATRMLTLLGDREPRPAPPDRISYSNANYLVLAAAIEAASGMNYYDYVERHVTAPLEMRSTTFGNADARPTHAAIGWIKDESVDPLGLGDYQANDGRVPLRGGPPGGTWTSAGDLGRFMDALVGGRLARRETLANMLADRRKMGRGFDYALGFMQKSVNGLHYFGHDGGGGNAGVSTSAFSTPDGAWTVVVLSNFSSPAGDDLGSRLMDLLLTVPGD